MFLLLVTRIKLLQTGVRLLCCLQCLEPHCLQQPAQQSSDRVVLRLQFFPFLHDMRGGNLVQAHPLRDGGVDAGLLEVIHKPALFPECVRQVSIFVRFEDYICASDAHSAITRGTTRVVELFMQPALRVRVRFL
ncbi:hypothetical protein B484DRAFT_441683 [Ochromonadaceae sp. CCMP2298]|nr:hypothetical protein B484DRAFT_441683 [Ochromonadaceae sp. CCMP2298]